MDLQFENFSSLLELVGDAGTATGNIAKGLETVKTLLKPSEGGSNADVKLALSELTMQIANAQMANSDLKFKLTALKDELAQINAFQSDLDRYELWETPPCAIVYRLRNTAGEDQPMHYLCPNCVEDRRKSILQGHQYQRQCITCDARFAFEAPTKRTRSTRTSNW